MKVYLVKALAYNGQEEFGTLWSTREAADREAYYYQINGHKGVVVLVKDSTNFSKALLKTIDTDKLFSIKMRVEYKYIYCGRRKQDLQVLF